METVGERIRRLRITKELTQEQLGQSIGVGKSTINKYESNIIAIPNVKVVKLAKALDVTPAYLMGWNEENLSKEQRAREDAAIIEAYHNATPEIQQAIQRILKH